MTIQYKNAGINAQSKFDAINRLVNDYASDKISLATNSREVDSIIQLGKKVAMIGVENAYPIGEDLNEIRRYAKLGARYMSLVHNGHNQFPIQIQENLIIHQNIMGLAS